MESGEADPAQDGAEVERVALLQTVHNATCYSARPHTWESGEHVICVRTARAIISTGQWGSARDAAVAAKVAEVEGVDPSDMRDVGNWLVREADQRAKFFPQRRDGVDALMRHIASDLFRAGLAPSGPDGADEDNWRCMVCRAVVPSGVFDAHQAAHRAEESE